MTTHLPIRLKLAMLRATVALRVERSRLSVAVVGAVPTPPDNTAASELDGLNLEVGGLRGHAAQSSGDP